MLWLIIIGVIVILGILFINGSQNKYQSFQGTVFNFLIVGLLIFLVVSVGYVYSKNEIEIDSFNDATAFFKIYYAWIANIFSNFGKVTGYAIQQDWFSSNSTK